MANIHDSGRAFVHRFQDRIAISVGDGSTFYLTRKQACEIADGLKNAAKDIEDIAFILSELRSKVVNIGGEES